MKILAIADVKPKHSLIDLVKSEPVDLVVTLGDLEYSEIAKLRLGES